MPKAFVMIDVHPGREKDVQEAITKISGVTFVYQVTGAHDMIALVDIEPYDELTQVVSKVRKLEGIRGTDTELVLR
jgi:DNA-binding Lrp family transcriptional regulator